MKHNKTVGASRSRAKVEAHDAEKLKPIIAALRFHDAIKEAHEATGLSRTTISSLYNHGIGSKITVTKLLKWVNSKTAKSC